MYSCSRIVGVLALNHVIRLCWLAKACNHFSLSLVTLIACRVHVITRGDDTSNEPTILSCIKYIAPHASLEA